MSVGISGNVHTVLGDFSMTSDLWVDKHEPKTLDDIVGQKDLVAAFKSYVRQGIIPNMTLAGAPGTGKTLIIKCFAADMGLVRWDEATNRWIDIEPGQFFILNASDDRGIDMVRTTLKRLARKPTLNGMPRLICLDEGDDLTPDAQGAMRALMQECSDNARFVICCNYPNKLLDPIISRCPMKEVYPLTKDDVKIVIDRIQKVEKFKIVPEAIDALYETTKGDLRKLIGKLQDACLVSNFNILPSHVVQTEVDLETAKRILEVAQTNYDQAREIVITTYINQRRTAGLLQKLYEATYYVRFSDAMPDNEIMQRRIREKIADIDYRLTLGTNALVQLDSIINYIQLIKFVPLQCPRVR